ncbi:DUF4390 domain-containing protein [Solimicrobium silvestre]|uniref:Proline rich signal peptide protein n=1 Tax=Solimicrobium silvestre TaxID=2099400 RepID=A0A2S9H0C8_9BURK|nr:DUF4390 domain-containing protein [Solimicrobium silvestre]PRC93316.1 hypothetical protein S2091_2054 [Solimicrobium silvestre]
MQRLIHLLLFSMLSCLLFGQPSAHASSIEISYARIESSDDSYRLAASFNFELTHELENVITSGIPLYFVTEVEITRPRWYWFDEKTITNEQTVRISYNVVTRQYRASVNGNFAQNYKDLDEALSLVRHPSRWMVAEKTSLSRGATYNIAVRSRLDTNQLPKPFQFNALNNSDWRLSSDWKRMTFKADEK